MDAENTTDNIQQRMAVLIEAGMAKIAKSYSEIIRNLEKLPNNRITMIRVQLAELTGGSIRLVPNGTI